MIRHPRATDPPEVFRDRVEAGQMLAGRLQGFARRDDVIVLALPRGGVPVGFEVAVRLQVPLDVLIVRKLGVPGREELAMGAIASGDIEVHEDSVIRMYGIPRETISAVARRERVELERRSRLYRGDRPLPELKDRIVILVDDGIATGSTMRAAVAALRKANVRAVVVATPVASGEAVDALWREADQVVTVRVPEMFMGIGLFYGNFEQTTDDEVVALLARSSARFGTQVQTGMVHATRAGRSS